MFGLRAAGLLQIGAAGSPPACGSRGSFLPFGATFFTSPPFPSRKSVRDEPRQDMRARRPSPPRGVSSVRSIEGGEGGRRRRLKGGEEIAPLQTTKLALEDTLRLVRPLAARGGRDTARLHPAEPAPAAYIGPGESLREDGGEEIDPLQTTIPALEGSSDAAHLPLAISAQREDLAEPRLCAGSGGGGRRSPFTKDHE